MAKSNGSPLTFAPQFVNQLTLPEKHGVALIFLCFFLHYKVLSYRIFISSLHKAAIESVEAIKSQYTYDFGGVEYFCLLLFN